VRDAEVRYAERGGKRLAYEVFGSGPSDLLVYQVSFPIDLMWELPELASFMETLGGFARVIVFDAPGNGASDMFFDFSAAPTIEMLCDGFSAVLDAAHTDRVTFLDMAYGVNGVTFTATYPGRVRSLIINNFCPSFPDLRDATAAERRRRGDARIGVESLESENPRVAHDPQLQQWWRRARRLLVSPHASSLQMDFAAQIDVEDVLSAVRTPTLVLHRRDNPVWDIETSRAAAAKLPQARFVDLPGSETELFLGDTTPVLTEIEQFLQEPETAATPERVLATVLFTDIASSTEQLAARGDDAWGRTLDEHDRTMERLVASYRGRVVKSTGDGVLATFDGPARAVRCAREMIDAASQQGIALRAGLHTGEIEFRSNDLLGIAVHTAERISALAEPSQILVSRTVVDLTAGSGLQFEPRGERELKGVPGSWPIFAATPTA
jgi:class 3 adenylate cyclase